MMGDITVIVMVIFLGIILMTYVLRGRSQLRARDAMKTQLYTVLLTAGFLAWFYDLPILMPLAVVMVVILVLIVIYRLFKLKNRLFKPKQSGGYP